ncbi:flowering time control protein FCA-like isoform X2 [Camellia sinensis]|uniref:flowering time control protein FCA-like isoform X2 n=1 Tax=Camellia sinensis TaxID=4442 RepID=UPI0010358E45|nr:flowering time control protein FCA-like isoform X2 [Camellia sinensis]
MEGCGFVKYFHREMAMATINALNGIYTMKGSDQPLIVQFVDPKRPRAGDPSFVSITRLAGSSPKLPSRYILKASIVSALSALALKPRCFWTYK